MSVWASDGRELTVINADAPTVHGHGRTLAIDVATAEGTNDLIRLGMWDADFTTSACGYLTLTDAQTLRDALNDAIARVAKANTRLCP